MDESEQPLSAEDWLARVEDKRAVALALQHDRHHCREAWLAAGSAVEFALKARIMRRERWNGWPSRDSRPDLHTHDLRILMRAAGIARTEIPAHLRAKWAVVLSWDHLNEYVAGRMPRKVARDMVQAAFGPAGVIEWLRTS